MKCPNCNSKIRFYKLLIMNFFFNVRCSNCKVLFSRKIDKLYYINTILICSGIFVLRISIWYFLLWEVFILFIDFLTLKIVVIDKG